MRVDARRLGSPEPHREEGAEDDRHLAEDVSGQALAEEAIDPVDVPRRLDAAVEHREEGALGALLGRELAGDEVDVGGDAREPLAGGLVEALEDLDVPLRRDHGNPNRLRRRPGFQRPSGR